MFISSAGLPYNTDQYNTDQYNTDQVVAAALVLAEKQLGVPPLD
jgi:hypothetical protein